MKIQDLPIINWFNAADQTAAEVMLNDFKALYGRPDWAKGGVEHDSESIPAPLYFRMAHVISMMFLVQNIQILLATLEAGTKEFQRMLNTAMRAQNQLHRALRDLEIYHSKLYPKPKQAKTLETPRPTLVDEMFPTEPPVPAVKPNPKQEREWAAVEANLMPDPKGIRNMNSAQFLNNIIMPLLNPRE